MWFRAATAAVGIWLMAAPAALDYGEPASNVDRILGPLAAAAAIIAVWEVTRPVRWVNVVIGLILVTAPWLLRYPAPALWNSVVCGAAMMFLAGQRGSVERSVGGGWRELWKSPGDPRSKGASRR